MMNATMIKPRVGSPNNRADIGFSLVSFWRQNGFVALAIDPIFVNWLRSLRGRFEGRGQLAPQLIHVNSSRNAIPMFWVAQAVVALSELRQRLHRWSWECGSCL